MLSFALLCAHQHTCSSDTREHPQAPTASNGPVKPRQASRGGWAWPPNPWGCIKRDRRRRLTHGGTGQSSAVPHPIASANELQPTQLPCSVDLKVWCRQDLAEDASKHAQLRALCEARRKQAVGLAGEAFPLSMPCATACCTASTARNVTPNSPSQ